MNLKESGGSIGLIETSVLFSKSLIVSMKMPISPGATIESEYAICRIATRYLSFIDLDSGFFIVIRSPAFKLSFLASLALIITSLVVPVSKLIFFTLSLIYHRPFIMFLRTRDIRKKSLIILLKMEMFFLLQLNFDLGL